MLYLDGLAPLAAFGAQMIDPGPKGGIDACVPLCRLAGHLGFRTVVVCDYDRNAAQAQVRLAALLEVATHVIRLPPGSAVEVAIIDIDETRIVAAFKDLESSYTLPLPSGWDTFTGALLREHAIDALKSNGGLHRQFVSSCGLPTAKVATAVLHSIRSCVSGIAPAGLIQL